MAPTHKTSIESVFSTDLAKKNTKCTTNCSCALMVGFRQMLQKLYQINNKVISRVSYHMDCRLSQTICVTYLGTIK